MSRPALSSFREKKGLSMDNERRDLKQKTTAPRHSHFSDDSHNLPDHRHGVKNKFLSLAKKLHEAYGCASGRLISPLRAICPEGKVQLVIPDLLSEERAESVGNPYVTGQTQNRSERRPRKSSIAAKVTSNAAALPAMATPFLRARKF